jgi:hypothetical protein
MAFGLDVTILGTGVRASHGFQESIGPWEFGPIEQADFDAFVRDAWRFSSKSDASWRQNERDSEQIVTGVLAQRMGHRGLVIIQNRLILAFKTNADTTDIEDVLARYPIKDPLPFGSRLYTVALPLPEPEGSLAESIEAELDFLHKHHDKTLRWVEPRVTFHLKPSDADRHLPASSSLLKRLLRTFASVGRILGLSSDVQDNPDEWQWPMIDLDEAWKTTKGDPTIVVAVIDDGFYKTSQLPPTYLSLDGSGEPTTPIGGSFHGTCCAALVGSPVDQEYGNGVAPKCTMHLVAVSDSMNSDGFAKAVKRCQTDGADVITCSVAPYGGTWMNLCVLQEAITDVHDHGRDNGQKKLGTLVVWAANNNNVEIKNTDLESFDPLLVVGATDRDDRRGQGAYGTGLDLLAPGIGVIGLNCDGTRCSVSDPGGGGASYAAPQVAGVAALILSKNAGLKWDAVTQLILRNCGHRPDNPPDPYWGWGRLNAGNAVDATPQPQQSPSQSELVTA